MASWCLNHERFDDCHLFTNEELLQKEANNILTALAASEKAREEDKLRIAQLEEALIYIGCRTDHNKDGPDAPCEICSVIDKALTSTPSALSEVLRAAGERYHRHNKVFGDGTRQVCNCDECLIFRKYEEEE